MSLAFNLPNTFDDKKRFGCGVVRSVEKNFLDKNVPEGNTSAASAMRPSSTKKTPILSPNAYSELKGDGGDGVLWGMANILTGGRVAQ